ncbi:MAG: hypothetical protein KGI98_17305, partial [Euryarchaeota archaeon]|nr:hypothetical protein [Euryarchaeota archaeon]
MRATVREAVQKGEGIPSQVSPIVEQAVRESGLPDTPLMHEAASSAVIADARAANRVSGAFRDLTDSEKQMAQSVVGKQTPVVDLMRQTGASDDEIMAYLTDKQRGAGLSKKDAQQYLASGAPPSTPTPPNVPATGATPPRPPSSGGSVLRTAEQIFNIPRSAVTAAAPFHGMFRHAQPFVVKDFKAWLSGWRGGWSAVVKEDAAQTAARLDGMKAHLSDIADQVGLKEKDLLRFRNPGHGIVGGEEEAAVNPLAKIPGVGEWIRKSQAGFSMSLNEVAYNAFRHLVEDPATGKVRAGLTPEQVKGLATDVNTAIGSGFNPRGGTIELGGQKIATISPPMASALSRIANTAFFSPQLRVSRMRIWTNFVEGVARMARDPADPVAQAYVKTGVGQLAGLAATYLLFDAAGMKTDLKDWASTMFGKIDLGPVDEVRGAESALGSAFGMGTQALLGHVYLDPTQGEGPLLRTIVRIVQERTVNAKGKESALNTGKFGAPTAGSVLSNYAQGQTNPALQPVLDWLNGRPIDWQALGLPMLAEAYLTGSGKKVDAGAAPFRDAVGRLNDGRMPLSPAEQAWNDVRSTSETKPDGSPTFPDLAPVTTRTVPGGQKGIALDDKELDRLQELTGQAREGAIAARVAAPDWATLGQGDKEKALTAARDNADKQGRVLFGLEHAQQASDDLGRTRGSLIALS